MAGGHVWQGGVCVAGACMAGGMHVGRVYLVRAVCGRGHVWLGGHECQRRGGVRGWGACMAGETATAADGTNPTGMRSCILL